MKFKYLGIFIILSFITTVSSAQEQHINKVTVKFGIGNTYHSWRYLENIRDPETQLYPISVSDWPTASIVSFPTFGTFYHFNLNEDWQLDCGIEWQMLRIVNGRVSQYTLGLLSGWSGFVHTLNAPIEIRRVLLSSSKFGKMHLGGGVNIGYHFAPSSIFSHSRESFRLISGFVPKRFPTFGYRASLGWELNGNLPLYIGLVFQRTIYGALRFDVSLYSTTAPSFPPIPPAEDRIYNYENYINLAQLQLEIRVPISSSNP